MQACSTYDDVNLVLRLYEMRREKRMRDARRWFVANFRAKTLAEQKDLCPVGSDEAEFFRQVVTYWDMAASFITAGVLNRELFFESNREMLLVWERIKALMPELREVQKDPHVWSNIEKVAESYVDWLKARGPGCYEAFLERVG